MNKKSVLPFPKGTGKTWDQKSKTLQLKCLLVSFNIRVFRDLELLYTRSKRITYQCSKKKKKVEKVRGWGVFFATGALKRQKTYALPSWYVCVFLKERSYWRNWKGWLLVPKWKMEAKLFLIKTLWNGCVAEEEWGPFLTRTHISKQLLRRS